MGCYARIRRQLLARSLLLLPLLLALLAFRAPAAAQAAPVIEPSAVENKFPDGVVFRATATASEPISEIRLRYAILPDGTAASARPEFDSGSSATVEVALDEYLAPGTIIKYHWEVSAGGQKTESPEETFFYDDIRFPWQKLEGDGLSVYHYTGDDEVVQNLHEVGVKTLADAEALLGVKVPFPVNVWIYETRDDMVPALPRTSPSYEARIITLGIRIASDTVLVLGEVSYDTLRHELTHVVTAEAGDSAFGSLPAWLDEGTAVYSQEDKGGYADAVEASLRNGEVLSIREMTAAPGEPEKVNLFYGESGSIVQYLVDEYGQAKFAQLFAGIKTGKTTDQALNEVYGFGQDGLENEWRAAHDLPARATPELTEAPQPSPGTRVGGEGDGGGTSTIAVVGIALGVIALVGAVGFSGIVIARRL
jgi:hypothetical protein